MNSLVLSCVLLASYAQDGRIPHTFELKLNRPVTSVHLAGTFNNWDRAATPMSLDQIGKWRVSVRLSPGRHLYKFVLNGSEWIVDPAAKKNEDDGGGNMNSVLLLLPADYKRSAKPGDGLIAKSALLHQPKAPGLNFDRGKLALTLRCRPDDLDHIEAFVESKGGEVCVELHEVARDELYATYRAEVPWDRKSDFRYRFMIVDGAKRVYLTPSGLSESPKTPYILSASTFKAFTTPKWVERAVFYQIFPDRFANGNTGNDPTGVQKWSDAPTYFNRFGGDAAGIRSRIAYLSELGINAIYFNPIFKSPSNHRYDATDYKLVDPEIGTNDEYFQLTRELKAAGIRTMLDFAFNHTAVDFGPFMDIRLKGQNSQYRDWYWIKSYPIEVKEDPNYVAWFNFPSMPKLNVMNPETHRFVLDVVDFWKKNSALDGIRLDVANEVDPRMWQALRKHVKSASPDTYILGEEWGDASKWLTGDQWDASMNYPFRDTCLRFFAEGSIPASEFGRRLIKNYSQYVPQVSRVQYNLLSSHDTPRFLTLCQGDKKLALLGAVTLFTWAGTPSIYYGEELGMEGGRDPENRRGMEWSLANRDNAHLDVYKKLISLRKSSVALQSGTPKILYTSDVNRTLAFSRVLDKDQAIIAINRSSATQRLIVSLPSEISARRFIDALSGAPIAASKDRLAISLPPMSAAILLADGSSAIRPRGLSAGMSTLRPSGARRNS